MESSIRLNPITLDDFRAMSVDWEGHLQFGLENYWEAVLGNASTMGLFVHDQCVCVLGGVPDQTGVVTIFALSSTQMRQSPALQRLMLKYANLAFQGIIGDRPCHFMQAIVNANDERHIRFIKQFGFEGGYRLPGYTPNGDDVLFFYKQVRQGARLDK